MSLTIAPAPVRKSIFVPVSPEKAFEVFTAGLDRWWPRSHSIGKAPMARAMLEPREGGRWYEVAADGGECDWGKVLAWEPPARLVLAWQIDGAWRFDPALVTEVEVQFRPEGEGTRVELEHRHIERMGETAEQARAAFESPGGWSGLLEMMAEAAGA